MSITERWQRYAAWFMRLEPCLLLALATLMVAGCAGIAMRHPDGRTVACGPYYAKVVHPAGWFADHFREAQCIKDYQRQGFERTAE